MEAVTKVAIPWNVSIAECRSGQRITVRPGVWAWCLATVCVAAAVGFPFLAQAYLGWAMSAAMWILWGGICALGLLVFAQTRTVIEITSRTVSIEHLPWHLPSAFRAPRSKVDGVRVETKEERWTDKSGEEHINYIYTLRFITHGAYFGSVICYSPDEQLIACLRQLAQNALRRR